VLDEYHVGLVTVHLYFVGVRYFEFKYPHGLMEDPCGPARLRDLFTSLLVLLLAVAAFSSSMATQRWRSSQEAMDENWRCAAHGSGNYTACNPTDISALEDHTL